MEYENIYELPNYSKKDLLLKSTAGGKLYYTNRISGLIQKSEFVFKNVSSPFRRDRNPSFQIQCDPSTNRWYFKDFGDLSVKGDCFSFAAMIYRLDIKKDYARVQDLMIKDLELDKVDLKIIGKILQGGDGTTDEQHYGIKIKSADRSVTFFYDETPNSKTDYTYTLHEIPFENLSNKEKDYLSLYGITNEALTLCKAKFISGYTLHYDEFDNKLVKKGSDEIWLCYCFRGYCKIYCPKPKKFWSIGKKQTQQYFGSSAIKEGEETIVLLTAGEKDVLSLVSHGFNAVCLNSETQNLDRSQAKFWYFDCQYTIIVLYDNDDTGIKYAKKLNETYKYPIIKLPDWVKEKGGKDVSDFFRLGGTAQELQELINEAIISKNETDAKNETYGEDIRLSVRTAAQRLNDAKNLPDIKPFIDVFFQSKELVIFFGDTGKGKSIFAVALADAISKGEDFLELENLNEPQGVLYYDFELSDKQFEKRYTDENGVLYPFNNNLFIDSVDLSQIDFSDKKNSFEEHIINMIRAHVAETGAKVVIIDNITFVVAHSPEDSEVAMKLMKSLKQLKEDLDISILALAHTPKKYSTAGIGLPDLAGSKHLSNFADSVFALGASRRDNNLRYLIQVKPSRSGEIKYDSDNVLVCEIQKIESLLTFVHRGFTKEAEHLITTTQESEEEMRQEAKKLYEQGKTIRQIADILKTVSKSTVGRWLKP